MDLTRREEVYHAARCILAHNLEEQELFNRAWAVFWAGEHAWLLETEDHQLVKIPI